MEIECGNCDGEGDCVCDACLGEGCDGCDGTGYYQCDMCHGQGSIDVDDE